MCFYIVSSQKVFFRNLRSISQYQSQEVSFSYPRHIHMCMYMGLNKVLNRVH